MTLTVTDATDRSDGDDPDLGGELTAAGHVTSPADGTIYPLDAPTAFRCARPSATPSTARGS